MLVAAMAVTALTGCGSNSGSSSKKDADKYYIGGIGPTTGATAIYGTAVKNGAQIAVDEINAAGGINGKQIEYRFEDDQNDAEKAVNAYNTLKDWGMQMLVGTTTTAPCIAVAGKTASDNLFQITPSASAPSVLPVETVIYSRCVLRILTRVLHLLSILQRISLLRRLVLSMIVLMYILEVSKKFEAEAKDKGLQIVSKAAFTADSKTDFGTQLQKAKDAGADLLFLPIYYREASIILKQADTMGYKPKFFGVDGMDGILTVENFDTKLAEDVMLLTPFAADAKDKTVQNFVKTYKEKYKDTPNQFAADSYDAVYALKAAIEESKATTDMSASDMCDALKGAMTKIKMQGLTGGKDGLTWNESGEVTKSPKAVIIKNGAYKAM